MKICNTCKESKVVEAFIKGHARCRDCYNIARRGDYLERAIEIRARKRKWGKEHPDYVKAAWKRWYEANKEYNTERWKEWASKPENKEKINVRDRERYAKDRKVSARRLIQAMVHRGAMPSATSKCCVDCGNQAQEYDHYMGYEREARYMVEPVCRECHRKRHSVE